MKTLIFSLFLCIFFLPESSLGLGTSASCLHIQQGEASWTLDAFCEGRKEGRQKNHQT